MNDQIKQNIVLVGFMGAGKTTVGKELAYRLNYKFMDTDYMIEEKTATTINEIFRIHGEEYFRDLETSLLKELTRDLTGTILSTGGGIPVREENIQIMRKLGYVVYLKLSRDTMIERLKGDTKRPLLKGYDLAERVDNLLKSREAYYRKAAHDIIISDNLSKEEIVDAILSGYKKLK
ncbi:MAG: shikimate kinase [Clostridiales bacterium]|jgi:shikimate kinase|nr:shikimate kinase [Clostridiales bacterium]